MNTFSKSNLPNDFGSRLSSMAVKEKFIYLMTILELSSIDIKPGYAGYWLLKKGEKMAIFSHHTNTLIQLPGSDQEDEYFTENVSLFPIMFHESVRAVFVSLGGKIGSDDILDIDVFGEIQNNQIQTIPDIPKGTSMRNALIIHVTRLLTYWRTALILDEEISIRKEIIFLEEIQNFLQTSLQDKH